jgi:hypothetical protein
MRASPDSFISLEDFAAQSREVTGKGRHLPELDEEDGHSVILWHGTTRSRAKTILRSGFRYEKTISESGRGFMYFTSDPRIARRYAGSKAKNEGDLPAVIMCSINLRHYDNFAVQNGSIYIFGHECISRDVIRDVEGLPKRQLDKLQGRKKQSTEFTDVALTFNSSCAGIAYWLNSYLELDESNRMTEDHEVVGKLKQWLDGQIDAGRFGEVPDGEILEQLQEYKRKDYGQAS